VYIIALSASDVVLEARPWPRGSSRTNFAGLGLGLGLVGQGLGLGLGLVGQGLGLGLGLVDQGLGLGLGLEPCPWPWP